MYGELKETSVEVAAALSMSICPSITKPPFIHISQSTPFLITSVLALSAIFCQIAEDHPMPKKHVVAVLQHAPELMVHVPGDGKIYIAQNPKYLESSSNARPSFSSSARGSTSSGSTFLSKKRRASNIEEGGQRSLFSEDEDEDEDEGEEGLTVASSSRPPTMTSAAGWGPVDPSKPTLLLSKNKSRHSMPGTKSRLPSRQELAERDEREKRRKTMQPRQGNEVGQNRIDFTIGEERQGAVQDDVLAGREAELATRRAAEEGERHLHSQTDKSTTIPGSLSSGLDKGKGRSVDSVSTSLDIIHPPRMRKQSVVPPALTQNPQAAELNLKDTGEIGRFDGRSRGNEEDLPEENFLLPPAVTTASTPIAHEDVQSGALSEDSGDNTASSAMPPTQASDGKGKERMGDRRTRDGESNDSTPEIRPHSIPTPFMRSRRRSRANARSSISLSRRKSKLAKSDEIAMDLDGEPDAISEDEVVDLLLTNSQLNRKKKEKALPAPLLGPYQAARSSGIAPGLGSVESSTRDSSVMDEESPEDMEAEGIAGDEVEATKPSTRVLKSSVDRPDNDDDDDDDDVVFVTSVVAGAPPAKPRKSKEERDADRKEREIRRAAKEERKKKRRRPLPTFRYTIDDEHAQLLEAYRERREALRQAGMEAENEDARADWRVFESFELPKGKERSDHNSVKFWPYHLPFPGRKKDEAIIAVAGGCSVGSFVLLLDLITNVVDTEFPFLGATLPTFRRARCLGALERSG